MLHQATPQSLQHRQRAYLLVSLVAFILQTVSATLFWSIDFLPYNVMYVLGMAICLIMIVFIALRFEKNLSCIHTLGITIASGWFFVDFLYNWFYNQGLDTDILLESNILMLLAYTFWPVRAAFILGVMTYGLLYFLVHLSKNDSVLTILMSGFSMLLIGFMSVYAQKISLAEARSEWLGSLAFRDPLTGLSNRYVADDRLAQLPRTANPEQLALVLFDLDHFKRVNDTLGHLQGDRALVHIAGILRAHVGAGDLLARWGGEEFLVVWPNIDRLEAQRRTENILQQVRQNALSGFPPLTLSGGGVMLGEAASVSAALSLADQRLYRAKDLGRDQAVWQEDG